MNGFLHVSLSHISKETVNPYYGYEIPNAEGLDPNKIYQGYRSGKALSDGAKTFNGLPILWDHHFEHAESPQKEFRIGSLGTDAKFNAPYLDNSLIFTDARAIKAIENGQKVELSAAYMFDPVFEPGTFEGQPYDFIMTNIRGNHVALVDEGRAGPDVVVADAKPKNRGMLMKLGKKLKKLLAVMDENPDIEATEVDLGKALLAVNELEAEEAGIEPEAIGLDEDKDAKIKEIIQTYFASASPEEIKKITDTLTDLAYSKATGDENVSEDEDISTKVEDEDTELPTTDEESDEKVSDEDKTTSEESNKGITAMDAALIVKTAESRAFKKVQDIHKAIQDVRHLAHFHSPHVFDSALSVYKAALRVSGINPLDHPKAAWSSLLRL